MSLTPSQVAASIDAILRFHNERFARSLSLSSLLDPPPNSDDRFARSLSLSSLLDPPPNSDNAETDAGTADAVSKSAALPPSQSSPPLAPLASAGLRETPPSSSLPSLPAISPSYYLRNVYSKCMPESAAT